MRLPALFTKQGIPEKISPIVIGILGYGNVSKGAQQIFDCLPVDRIEPENVKLLIENKKWSGARVSDRLLIIVLESDTRSLAEKLLTTVR